MTAPATRAVLEALGAGGAEVRFVGGCVRDAVASRPIADIDLATRDRPEEVIRLLRAASIGAIPTGIQHGTVTAVAGRERFEITTLRVDVETDGRRARVAFTDDWEADAARRDLTMNTMSLTPDGTLYDPFGGREDLAAGRVRFVGDARERIREDVLRLLRFFRFYAHYGTPPPDPEGLAACVELASLLPSLSAERVWAETSRMLAAPEPAAVLVLMAENGVLAHFLDEARCLDRLAALADLETSFAVPDALRRLAAVLEVDADGARAVAARLKLSNKARGRLVALVAGWIGYAPPADAPGRRRLLYRHGASPCRDLTLLHWAGRLAAEGEVAPAAEALYRDMLGAAASWTPIALPVKGADIMALGVPRGPRVGELLEEMEAWWRDGDFQAGREEILAALRARLADAAKTRKQQSTGKPKS